MYLIRNKLRGAKTRLYKPFRPKKPLLKQIDFRSLSFLVPVHEDIGWRLRVHREYEVDSISCLEKLINKRDVCIDVGANVGIYSLFMAQKACNGKVIAFEPLSLNRHMLCINAALNRIENIDVRDSVLSDKPGVVEFSVSEDAAYSSMRPTGRKKEISSLKVQASSIDEIYAEGGQRVNVIKVDAEGAELLVLQGAEKLLSTPHLRPRVLLVELNAQNQAPYNYGPEDVLMYMKNLGYSANSVSNKGPISGWSSASSAEEALFLNND